MHTTVSNHCPFCTIDGRTLTWSDPRVVAFADAYAVSPGHTLVVPRRHVATYFDATDDERASMWIAVDAIKQTLDATLKPDGYNVGFNAGAAAGQTVAHAHIHVIPRYARDVDDPRGGVRWVIPNKARYWGDR